MSVGDDPEVSAAVALLDAHLAADRERRGTPGVSAAAVLGGELVWSAGHGQADVHRGRAASGGTIYRVGSITKLLTATMLMQLRDAGQVHLDDPITRYLPEFDLPSRFSGKAAPTFRELVSHTSGMPREAPLDYGDTDRVPPIAVLLASLRETDLSLAPLTAYKYSNLGFAVMGHALERIAGQPYVDYVSQHILRPLGMASSAFAATLTAGLRSQVAVGYYSGPDRDPSVAPYIELGGLTPAGGLYTSVEDLARLIMLQCAGDRQAGAPQILRSATLREMRAPLFLDADWNGAVGIAWRLARLGEHTLIRHGGSLDGFHADVSLIPALGIGVAVCANGGASPAAWSRAALEVLAPVAARRREREASAPEPPPGDGKAYVGRYRVLGAVATVAESHGRLTLTFGAAEAVLRHERDRVFRVHGGGTNDGELVTFHLDETGRAIALHLMDSVGKRIADQSAGP